MSSCTLLLGHSFAFLLGIECVCLLLSWQLSINWDYTASNMADMTLVHMYVYMYILCVCVRTRRERNTIYNLYSFCLYLIENTIEWILFYLQLNTFLVESTSNPDL